MQKNKQIIRTGKAQILNYHKMNTPGAGSRTLPVPQSPPQGPPSPVITTILVPVFYLFMYLFLK